MSWKSQCCYDVNSLSSVVYIQCNLNIIAGIFVEIEKLIPNSLRKNQRNCKRWNNFENYKLGGLKWPHSKNYHKATLMKRVWYWCKDRHINQCKKVEFRYRLIHKYQQIFHKYVNGIQWRKNNLLIWHWDLCLFVTQQ